MKTHLMKAAVAGVLTTGALLLLSWSTAHNFKAEGPDTALSQALISPLQGCGKLLQHLGLDGLSMVSGALLLTSACFAALYFLVLQVSARWRHQ